MSDNTYPDYIIYTDGAWDKRTGAGAYSAILFPMYGDRLEISGARPKANTGRIELMAAVAALVMVEGRAKLVTLYTDSMYVLRGIMHSLEYWRAHNWTRFRDGETVSNVDLWRRIDSLVQGGMQIQCNWVRSQTTKYNRQADMLARKALDKYLGRIV